MTHCYLHNSLTAISLRTEKCICVCLIFKVTYYVFNTSNYVFFCTLKFHVQEITFWNTYTVCVFNLWIISIAIFIVFTKFYVIAFDFISLYIGQNQRKLSRSFKARLCCLNIGLRECGWRAYFLWVLLWHSARAKVQSLASCSRTGSVSFWNCMILEMT